jgi:hypothetical protein
MIRRTLLVLGAVSLLVASTAIAPGARLPISQVTVDIVSVDPQSVQRDEYRRESFKDGAVSSAVSSSWTEKTAVITKARIKAVLLDDGHGLSPGTVIDLHYEVVRGSGPVYSARAPEVKPGETWTIGIWNGYGPPKGGTSFEVRGWTKLQTDVQPPRRTDVPTPSNVGGRP